MKRGKWYLVYAFVNEEKTDAYRGRVIEDRKIPLTATTEAKALKEATAKWGKIREGLENDPPILTTDPKPRVVYQIRL